MQVPHLVQGAWMSISWWEMTEAARSTSVGTVMSGILVLGTLDFGQDYEARQPGTSSSRRRA
jgi:hypothetical protein